MKQALALFEGNEYDLAFKRMKKLVEQERSVENIHNLAWMYVNEEEDLVMGQQLAEEAVKLESSHPFPSALLSEIYLKNNNLTKAEQLLIKVLEKERIPSVIHNLGVLYAKKMQWKEAADCFHDVAKPSSYIEMLEAYCHIQAGDFKKAKDLLVQWDENHDNFIGWIEAADLWIELAEYRDAEDGFKKEWRTTIPSSYVIDRYSYLLYRLEKEEELFNIQKETLINIKQELRDVSTDEDWTEEEKQEQILQLEQWQEHVLELPAKLKSGFIPPYEIEFFIEGGCYLFGCVQHNHPFYKDI